MNMTRTHAMLAGPEYLARTGHRHAVQDTGTLTP